MKRIYNWIIFTLIILLSSPQMSFACAVCFKGDADDPASRGLRGGIIVLLIVLLGVLGLFSTFFINIWRRSKTLGDSL